MVTKNKAKFFCENCGAEVPENAKLCKKCGKFFISVRCPNCGRTGTSREFKKGCPDCGYAMGKAGNSSAKTMNNARALGLILGQAGRYSQAMAKSRHEHSLPLWIYITTVVMFAAVMFGVYSCIKSPLY